MLNHSPVIETSTPSSFHTTTLNLDPTLYAGGIALWGALPPVYNTSDLSDRAGIHVHARHKVGGKKAIDDTYDAVEVNFINSEGRLQSFVVDSEDAVNYNISTILKKQLKCLVCPNCQIVHRDHGPLALHYHQQHQCEHCCCDFSDTEPSISNPIMLLKKIFGDQQQDRTVIEPSDRNLHIHQSDWHGGVQVWGSNPAILWTSSKSEETGIHVHGFRQTSSKPAADETFSKVEIDGIIIDPEMVRYLMAQQALALLESHVCSLDCPKCKHPHFDRFDMATIPHSTHRCEICGHHFDSPSDRPYAISNPFITIRETLYTNYKDIMKLPDR
jgi:transposase-like protein